MKRVIPALFGILFASGLFGQGKQAYVYKYRISPDDDKKVTVTCEVEDGKCTLVIVKDGETKKVTFPLDSLNVLEHLADQMGLDTDIDILKRMDPLGHRETTWLGVHVQTVSEQLRDYFKVRTQEGVLVSEVVEGSPADKAGLTAGDVILSVDRDKIKNADDLVDVIRSKEAGDEVSIKFIRNGHREKTTATLESRSSEMSKQMRLFSKRLDKDVPPPLMLEHGSLDLRKEMESLTEQIEELRDELRKLKEEWQEKDKP